MFKIITDSSADLPVSFLEENNIGCMNLSCIIDGEIYGQDKPFLDAETFYGMMKNGALPTTSQINPDEAKAHLLKFIQETNEILYIGFSSGLSGSVNSVRIAAEEIMEEYSDVKIRIIDSLCAASGQALIVYKAVMKKKEGLSMDEVGDYVEQNMLNVNHLFTVDNLFDLWRGGRVSKTSAFIGTLASIKPQMKVDENGKLVVINKIRGRKKALESLVDYMADAMGSRFEENKELICISHGFVEEDALYVKKLIEERFGFQNFMITNIGAVIGSHTGPSVVVISYMGENR